MHGYFKLAIGVSILPMLALSAAPGSAFPGKGDRAQAAIAEAKGKIDAVNKVGVSGDVPGMVARAQAALATAQEDVSRGDKDQAIADAHHASELADTAMGIANRNRLEAERAHHADAMAATAAAQQDAAEANARADAAQQAAATAAAQAEAMRNTPPPAPPTTTVTVEKKVVRPAPRRVTHRVVRHTSHPSQTATEKTTITTSPSTGD